MHNYRNNFNFIRLGLAFLVVVSHSFELIDGNRGRELLTRAFGTYSFGEFAVNAFFILSGYFIAASWTTSPGLRIYLHKRLLRILPGFVVAVAVTLAIVGPLGSPDFWAHVHQTRLWIGLLFLSFESPYSFSGQPYQQINGALWTIHYELFCYLLLAAIGLVGLLRHRRVVTLLFAGALGAYIGYLVLEAYGAWRQPGLLGIALNRLGHYVRFIAFFLAGVTWFVWRDRFRMDRRVFGGALLFTLLLFGSRYTAPVAMTIPFVYILYYLGNLPCSPARWFDGVDLSYGFYLYAWPIQQLLLWYGVVHGPSALLVWTTVLGLLVAVGSWFCVEQPFLRLKPLAPVGAGRLSGAQQRGADPPRVSRQYSV